MDIEIKFNNDNLNFLINEKALKNKVETLLQYIPVFEIKKIIINFTTEMLEDVEEFQRLNGLNRIGMTEHAIGKAFTITKGEHYIFLKFSNFKRLAQCDYVEDENILVELHYLHHELAHLYDGSVIIEVLPETFYSMDNLTLKEQFLYEIAKITWCEYKANFISAVTLRKDNLENYFRGLINCFINMEKRIRLAKLEIDMDNFNCLEIQYLTKDLFYPLGQIIGLIHGSENKEFQQELSLVLFKKAKEYDCLNIVQSLMDILEIMDLNYLAWETYEVLKPLNNLVEGFIISKNMDISNNLLFYIRN